MAIIQNGNVAYESADTLIQQQIGSSEIDDLLPVTVRRHTCEFSNNQCPLAEVTPQSYQIRAKGVATSHCSAEARMGARS